MEYLMGFAPWIVFWVIAGQHGKPTQTLLVASLVALVIDLVAIALQRKKGGVSSLDIGGAVFFAGFAVASLVVSDTWLATHNQFVSSLALFLIVAVGSLIGRPFTLAYARRSVPEAIWDDPQFLHSNVVITRVWVLALGVMTISSALLFALPDDSAANAVFNYIVPFGAFGLTIIWQNHYVAGLGDAPTE